MTKPAIKRKLNFGNLKIRNKIIFGFFIVSMISGMAIYLSNSFIVNEFKAVNGTMHMFHNVFAKQKKVEIMVENYIASETKEIALISDFDTNNKEIAGEFGEFMRRGESFLDKDMVERFTDKSGVFFAKEYEVISVHKKKIERSAVMRELQAQEKAQRYVIREYVADLSDSEMYTVFLYSEYLSKEMLYQYKDSEHAKKWLDSLGAVKALAVKKSIAMPGFDEYYNVASRTSQSIAEVNLIDQEEQVKIKEFRASIEDLNNIQEEVSLALTTQNLKEIDTIVIVGVFLFTFAMIFFTILFGYFISTFISWPIKKLADFASAAGKGDFHSRVSIDTDDEVGQTADAFNLMLDKVEESTLVLEAKVSARTKRLEELSKNLEDQVSDKTKELNEKINELERFNDLAVGRELAMVELKKEMEKLKQSSNEKKGKKKASL